MNDEKFSIPANKFEVGNYVKAYNGTAIYTGPVIEVGYPEGCETSKGPYLKVNTEGVAPYWFHPKQCRLLKKKLLREWWINERAIKTYDPSETSLPLRIMFSNPRGGFLDTKKPVNIEGWICVREVKKNGRES